MKKTCLCATVFLLATRFVFAQHTEPALLRVNYNFIYLYDKVNKKPPVEVDVTLRVGKTNSMFMRSEVGATQKTPLKQNNVSDLNMGSKTKIVGGTPIISVASKESNDEVVYQLPAEEQIIKTRKLGFQDYKIEVAFPKIEWKVEQATRNIGGYNCQKAVGVFGGRTYTAWFAPDLPFRYGPWKLCGLPGLILEAADAENEVVFKFKSVVKNNELDYILIDSYRPIVMKEDAFEKARKNYDKDPIEFSRAQLKSDATVSQINYVDASGRVLTGLAALAAIKEEKKKVITNPMELDKQQ